MSENNNNITVCAIAALANDRIIGKNGGIPWDKIQEDMKRFVEVTRNRPVIMGRVTLESIINKLGGPLPKRTTVVITSDKNYQQTLQDKFSIDPDNQLAVEVAHSPTGGLKQAKSLARSNDQDKICIAGGGSIYKALLPETDELTLTLIGKNIEANESDTFTRFPNYRDEFTHRRVEARHTQHDPPFTFVTLTR